MADNPPTGEEVSDLRQQPLDGCTEEVVATRNKEEHKELSRPFSRTRPKE